jgi:hypothetical protein
MDAVAALRPEDDFEARLAVRIVAMGVHADDALRSAGLAAADPAEVRRCRAQAIRDKALAEPHAHCSEMNRIAELAHQPHDFINPARTNQLSGGYACQQFLWGENPLPRFVRLVEIGELVNDIFQLQQCLFRGGVWIGAALIPP